MENFQFYQKLHKCEKFYKILKISVKFGKHSENIKNVRFLRGFWEDSANREFLRLLQNFPLAPEFFRFLLLFHHSTALYEQLAISPVEINFYC